MKSFTIKLDTVEKVKEFSSIINKYEGIFDLISDKYILDAKSIMGIFSLDITKPLKLEIQNVSNISELEKELHQFM